MISAGLPCGCVLAICPATPPEHTALAPSFVALSSNPAAPPLCDESLSFYALYNPVYLLRIKIEEWISHRPSRVPALR